jgi:hypothetical protein
MLTAVNKLTLLLEPPSVAVDVKIGGVTTFDGPDGVVGHKVALMTPMIVFASVRNRHPLPQRHHHPLPAYSTTFTTSVRPLHKSYSCYGVVLPSLQPTSPSPKAVCRTSPICVLPTDDRSKLKLEHLPNLLIMGYDDDRTSVARKLRVGVSSPNLESGMVGPGGSLLLQVVSIASVVTVQ